MKRLLSVALALCMAMSLVSALAESPDLIGDWYAVKMGDGETFVDVAMYGLSMKMTLNEDGTSTIGYGDGDLSEAVWEASEDGFTLTMDDEVIQGTYADGELSLSSEGQVIVFSQEAPDMFTPAEAKADATVEDYNGVYSAAYLNMGGSYLPAETAESFGMTFAKMTLENGVPSFEGLDLETAGFDTMMNFFAGKTMELKDGKLVIEDTETGMGMAFTLLQDGLMLVDLQSDGESLFGLIYAPAAE